MKNYLVPLLLMLSMSSFAGEKGNGGETVDVNGIPRLRDLVETTNCSWVSGTDVMAQNPLTAEALRRVGRLDWYFAAELKQEILDLDYCLTGNLVRVDTSDIENLVAVYETRTGQVAIRFNRQVYINEGMMNRMPEIDRAMLVIHEAMHSYLGRHEVMRNQKLRSQIQSIYKVFQGQIATTESLHKQMENNSIQFPRTSKILLPLKEAVLLVIGTPAEKREIVFKSKSLKVLLANVKKINPRLLTPWHAELLNGSELVNLSYQGIMAEDIALLEKLLSEKEFELDVYSMLFTHPAVQESEILRDYVQRRGHAEEFMRVFLAQLAQKSVKADAEGRLVINGMELLAQNGIQGNTLSFTALDALRDGEMHPRMKAYLALINTVIATNDPIVLSNLVHENPAFYAAFSVIAIQDGVKAMDSTFGLEKTTALRKIDTLLEGFWSRFRAEVIAQNGQEMWEDFAKKIDTKRLGYKIK